MSAAPKQIGKWRKAVSTKVGLWLIFSLVAGIFVFAAQISEGEYDLLKALLISPIAGALILAVVFSLLKIVAWFFCWKNLKLLFFRCGMILLILLFIRLEENWRGKHAWEKYREEWEAKGEKFDLKAFIPPSVPDEQNFATTPVVASCYECYFDRSGHLNVPRRTNVVDQIHLELYKANFSSESWPTNGDWRFASVTDLEGWQIYYRESYFTNQDGIVAREFLAPEKPMSPGHDILVALGKYDGVLEELRVASQRPASRFPLTYESEEVGSILLPHLSSLKRVTQVLELRALAALEKGDNVSASRDTIFIFNLADKIRGEPFLISQMVRVSMIEMGVQVIYEGLAKHCWSEPQLIELSKELSRFNLAADYKFAMRCEAAFQVALCDYLRKHPSDLFTLVTGVGCLHDHNESQAIEARLIGAAIPPGWIYQNQLQAVKSITELVIPIANQTNRVFDPNKCREYVAGFDNRSLLSIFHYFKWIYTPGLGRSAQRCAVCQQALDFSIIAIALERHRMAKGEFPNKLESLVPNLLPQLPGDVIGGQPLKYRREKPNTFILYSVGWNQIDDGGVVVLTGNSYEPVNPDLGDWVWRYPTK